jgi:hypothetical protein
MPPCVDDQGNQFDEDSQICGPNGVVWRCNNGEWVSSGEPCAGHEPRPPLNALLTRAHNLLQPAKTVTPQIVSRAPALEPPPKNAGRKPKK